MYSKYNKVSLSVIIADLLKFFTKKITNNSFHVNLKKGMIKFDKP